MWFLNDKTCDVGNFKKQVVNFLVWFIGKPVLSRLRVRYLVSIGDDKLPSSVVGDGVWVVITGKFQS